MANWPRSRYVVYTSKNIGLMHSSFFDSFQHDPWHQSQKIMGTNSTIWKAINWLIDINSKSFLVPTIRVYLNYLFRICDFQFWKSLYITPIRDIRIQKRKIQLFNVQTFEHFVTVSNHSKSLTFWNLKRETEKWSDNITEKVKTQKK